MNTDQHLALHMLSLPELVRCASDWASLERRAGQANLELDDLAPLVSGIVWTVVDDHVSLLRTESMVRLDSDRTTNRAFFRGVDWEKWRPWSDLACLAKRVHDLAEEVRRARGKTACQAAIEKLQDRYLSILTDLFESDKILRFQNGARDAILRQAASSVAWHDVSDRFPSFRVGWRDDEYDVTDARLLVERIVLGTWWEQLLGGWDADAFIRAKTSHEVDEAIQGIIAARASLRRTALGEEDAGQESMPVQYLGPVDKKPFGSLCQKFKPPRLSPSEDLREKLLWYNVDSMDSSRGKILLGGPTVVSLAVGELAHRRRHDNPDPITVMEVRHEGPEPWYSYAVLLERYGTLSDMSAWLAFPQAGGDYVGMGGSMLQMIRDEFNQENPNVEIVRHEMAFNDFVAFLERQDMPIGPSWQKADQLAKRMAKAAWNETRTSVVSLLLEYGAERYARYVRGFPHVEASLSLSGRRECDVFAWTANKRKALYIECKATLPWDNLASLINSMQSKAAEASCKLQLNLGTQVELALAVPQEALSRLHRRDQAEEMLRKRGVQLLIGETDLANSFRKGGPRDNFLRGLQGP